VRRLAVTDAGVIVIAVAIAQLGKRPRARVNGHIGGENPAKVVDSLCATLGSLRSHLPLSALASL
jgi:hypothetical protein